MNTIQMYDTQAGSIKMKDITSKKNNRVIIERMRRNNADDEFNTFLRICDDDDDQEGVNDYFPEGAEDMGWLGYFVGRNDHLKELYLRFFDTMSIDVIKPFFSGVANNKSICKLNFFGMDLLGGKIFTMLGPFFKNTDNLEEIYIEDCNFGVGVKGSRVFALALSSFSCTSLRELTIMTTNIPDEGLVDIITSLSMHTNLHYLDLDGNQLQTNGCKALATLLKCSVTKLETIDLRNNELDDESIHALVPGLKSCSHLKKIYLMNNLSVTSRGWQNLATILESPNSNLETLSLEENNIDDQAVASFVGCLVNNSKLHTLDFQGSNAFITDEGWKAFSKLLCNTSSVNSTYLSNHILRYGPFVNVLSLRPLLYLNGREDKKEVAMIKILQHHNEIDMMPFFEWEFKVLPLMIDWLERASSVTMPENFEANIIQRKLSSIYQFVRGMPLLYVETYLRKELEDIKAARKQKQEKQRELEEELVILGERQKSIMKRLGQQQGGTFA